MTDWRRRGPAPPGGPLVPEADPRGSTAAQRFALALACAGFAVSAALYSDSLLDDAYIVFRYADNLVAGIGPVFNPGEWVEGFSSPLWLLLVAVGRAAGAAPESTVRVLGISLGMGAIIASWALGRRLAAGWPALIPALLLALHPAHAMWSVHGLETPLFVLLVAAAFAAWGGDTPRATAAAGALFGLAFWTRPEAPLFVAILAVAATIRGNGRRAVRLVSWFASLAIPLLTLRLLLYGSLVPNTFHAKTGGGIGRLLFGLGSARLFVQSHWVLVAACAGVAALIVHRLFIVPSRDRGFARALCDAPRSRAVPPLPGDIILCGLAWSAWVVWIGGDAFPGYRFWLPVLPLAGALAGWLVAEASGFAAFAFSAMPRLARPALLATAAAGLAVIATTARTDVLLEYSTGKEFTARMLAVGYWLGENAPREAVIALNYVGAVPYRSGLRTIDMLGLTDPLVGRSPIRGRFRFPGHARGNGASILDRAPELILMGGVSLAPAPTDELFPELDSEEQIVRDARFAERYERVQVQISAPGGSQWFAFYKRKDFAWRPADAITP